MIEIVDYLPVIAYCLVGTITVIITAKISSYETEEIDLQLVFVGIAWPIFVGILCYVGLRKIGDYLA